MPELPEVETTRRGLLPHVESHRVLAVTLRRPDLRWPVPTALQEILPGQRITRIERRAKYLLLHTAVGSALIHLGMSGSLRVLASSLPAGQHDHYDLLLDSGRVLRYTDQRRFGCLLWQAPGTLHPLLATLGPEPLSAEFDGDYLWHRAHGRSAPIKTFLMDQRIVVGVGNIYAAEALFAAAIHPLRGAGRVSRARCAALADAVKRILGFAIARGGTTLRDFISPDGVPGYFEQELSVYGRAGQPCKVCGHALRVIALGQRSSFYCPHCQH